jgi:hypothetical protein
MAEVLGWNETRVQAVGDERTSMTEATLPQQFVMAARREHVIPGREIHMREMRGYRFCEVGLITGTGQDTAIANIWNTTCACDPTPEQLDALDAEAVAREHGAVHAWLTPARQCVFDRLDVWEVGDDRTFGTISGTWMSVASAADVLEATVPGSYDSRYVYRNHTFTFNRGREVYLLVAPDGEVFVMQSFSRHAESTLGEDDLPHLGGRLALPVGWGFRAEMLDRDLEVSSGKENLAHVLYDNLDNVYQGSDVGRAFSPPFLADSFR